jgi:hypothetical protein
MQVQAGREVTTRAGRWMQISRRTFGLRWLFARGPLHGPFVRLPQQAADDLERLLARAHHADPGLRRVVRVRKDLVPHREVVAAVDDAAGAQPQLLVAEEGAVRLTAHADVQTVRAVAIQPGYAIVLVVGHGERGEREHPLGAVEEERIRVRRRGFHAGKGFADVRVDGGGVHGSRRGGCTDDDGASRSRPRRARMGRADDGRKPQPPSSAQVFLDEGRAQVDVQLTRGASPTQRKLCTWPALMTRMSPAPASNVSPSTV